VDRDILTRARTLLFPPASEAIIRLTSLKKSLCTYRVASAFRRKIVPAPRTSG
jgi:hypothetical protein